MGLFSGTKGFVVGFTTGFGAGLFARDLMPHVKDAMAPAMKFALRTSLEAAERSRELTARFGELLQDTLAEVQLELRQRKQPPRSAKSSKASLIRPKKKSAGARKAKPAASESNVIDLERRRSAVQ